MPRGSHDGDVERQPIGSIDASSEEKNCGTVPGWDGPDDPENPLNWSTTKKTIALGLVSLITLLSPLGSTIISPATSSVAATFHTTSPILGALVTTIYLLGYTFGPLILAPLSEVIGRSPVYNACNAIFVLFNVACALAPGTPALIIFRFFAGIGASCPMTLGAGSIADMVPAKKRGAAMAAWVMGPVFGPSFGPLAGAYLAQAKGWRWIFWLMTIVSGIVSVLTFFCLKESYAPVILARKARRQGITASSAVSTAQLFRTSISRPTKMLIFSPIVFLLSLYMAFIYGTLYLLFTTFPRVFEGQYGWSASSVGMSYIGMGVGCFVGLMICGAAVDSITAKLKAKNGDVSKPEHRLPLMIFGAVLIPAALFLYGWTADKKLHWTAPIIGTALLGGGMFLIYMPAATYLVDAFTVYAASATAAATVFRSLMGTFLPLAGDSMYDALGLGWGTSLIGFIALVFIPVPLLFWRYGERLRNVGLPKVSD